MKNLTSKLLRCSSRASAGLAAALAVILLGASAPPAAAQSDNFNDGNDTAGVAWTHYSLSGFGIPYGATTYSFPSDGSGGKAYSLSAASTGTDIYGVKNPRGASYVKTNIITSRFSMGADLLAWSTIGRPELGLIWYFHDIGLGTSDAYIGTLSISNRNIYISSITNEAQQAYFCRLADGDIVLNATNRVRLAASSHDGQTFVFTIYNLAQPNTPWASVVGADTTWYGYGTNCGVIIVNEDYPSANGVSATFDNYLATVPAAGAMPAMVTDVYPPPAGKSKGAYPFVTNSVMILNRDTSVDPSSIMLSFDGNWIPTGSLTIDSIYYKQYNPSAYQQYFNGWTVTCPIPNLLSWGSQHTNVVVFSDNNNWYTNAWSWTVGYNYLFASNSLPIGSLTKRGFDARMVQSYNYGTNLPNSLARALQQLGIPPQITIDKKATSIVQVLDWNKASAPPKNVPGLCAGTNLNIAVQSLAYLELSAGVHRFHINSDDRAGLYSGTTLADANALAIWENPDSTANTTFDFVVEADGLYPVNCIWEETGGSAVLHLWSVNLSDATETLVNDPNDPVGVVKAWYPVVCRSSSSASGPYALASTAVNVVNTADIVGSDCSPTVVGQYATGGTLTIPVSGTTQFYRLDTPRKATLTGITQAGSNIVITYQLP